MYIVLEAFHIYLSKGWLKQIYENTVLSGQYGMAGKSLNMVNKGLQTYLRQLNWCQLSFTLPEYCW